MQIYLQSYILYDFDQQEAFEAKYSQKPCSKPKIPKK